MILWQFLQIKFLTIFLPSITSEEWSLWYYRNSNKFCQYFLTSNGFVLKVFIRFKNYILGCDWWLHFLMTGFLQTNYRFAFSYHSVFHSFLLVIIFAFDLKIQLKIWLLYNGDTLSSSHCLQCCIKTDLISLSCCDQRSSLLAWVLHRCLFVIWHLNFLNLVVTSFTNGEFCNVGNSPQGTLYKLHICKFLNCRMPITTPKTIITQKKRKRKRIANRPGLTYLPRQRGKNFGKVVRV